jgi:hypothetical protein
LQEGIEMNVEKLKLMRISTQPSTVHILIDQKQMDNVEYLNFLQSLVTDDVICIHAIQFMISMAEAAFYKKKTDSSADSSSNLRKKLVKCYILSIALCGAETWTLW